MNARHISRSIRKHASISLCAVGVGVMLCEPAMAGTEGGWAVAWAVAVAVVAVAARTAGRILDTEARAKKIQSLKYKSL